MILQNGRALSKKDMRRILLTCTMAFTLLPVFGGEGKAPPMNKEKSLLIDYVDPFIGTLIILTIKMHVGGLRLMNIPIVSLQDILM